VLADQVDPARRRVSDRSHAPTSQARPAHSVLMIRSQASLMRRPRRLGRRIRC
jgi:hypothetical protein